MSGRGRVADTRMQDEGRDGNRLAETGLGKLRGRYRGKGNRGKGRKRETGGERKEGKNEVYGDKRIDKWIDGGREGEEIDRHI